MVAVLAVLGGDVVASSVSCTDHCQAPVAAAAPAAPPPAPEPAALSITPAPGADDVDPTKRVLIIAASGTLSGVEMVNENGKSVPGVMTPDNRAWKPTIQLGYGHTYTMTVASRGPSGMPARETSSFTTLTPSDQTEVYFETIGGNALRDGGTYGIGNVIVAHFDEPITDKASAERHLKVTTNPPVAGSWNWISDQVAHWRPEKYYAPGTKVSVEADIYGTPLGGGLYGEDNAKASFTIGDSHVSIADDNTHQVQVFNNGQLVRTMPTSMGMGGYQTIAGTTFSFFTPPGAYTVIDKANPVIMDSSTFGLPTNSRLGYKETISYATKISIDGIYLHQLDSTVWAQGNTDTSHGCLNLNADNASWFFNFAVPGDVVEVKNTGGPPLQISQGGDWTVPWDQWIKGSALSV
ncbi:L,D-transpeptidase [Mycolicibacterium komossense]|uniref:L,D-transpeptidase n=1 Tax=Mycolicibacterium komossense TaxID=1779 RepID=A0ABT3CDS7_9MYCO|nr:L,D-transpeptidase [Mycolicibacterium komossense]